MLAVRLRRFIRGDPVFGLLGFVGPFGMLCMARK